MVSILSVRGKTAAKAAEISPTVWDISANIWHPVDNPTGYVSLGIAENTLMHNELASFLASKPLISENETRLLTFGDGVTGSNNLRTLLARFFNNYFRPFKAIKREHIIVTNGVTSIIEHCSFVLANPGDGILLGRPYFKAFLPDISLRTGVKCIPVTFDSSDICGPSCVAKYEEALLKAKGEGVRIRALLLCNPHNPLNLCYPRDTLEELMRLCGKYSVHLISDEIYALSLWNKKNDTQSVAPTPFTSLLSIQTRNLCDPALIHTIWGVSKDFGANGLRIGVLVSQSNPTVLAAIKTCGQFSSPSSLAERAVEHILSDENFLKTYISTNQRRLGEAHAFAFNLLQRHGIQCAPGANAAFFIWVNLAKKYVELRPEMAGQDTSAVEKKIAQELIKERVYVVEGKAAGAEEPGWFRLVFSQNKDIVEEAIRRIIKVVS